MARRMGRPPLPEDERRSERLALRVTLAERGEIEQAARAVGVELSDYVRGVTLRAARRRRKR